MTASRHPSQHRDLPHPVAAALGRARDKGASDPALVAGAASVFLRFTACALLADAWRTAVDDAVEPCIAALRAPTPGAWGGLVSTLATSVRRREDVGAFFPRALDWASTPDGRASAEVERLVALAEGRDATLASLESVAASAGWMIEHRLVRVLTAAATPDGAHVGLLQAFVGSDEIPEPYEARWDPALEVDGLYLESEGGDAFLDVRPLMEVLYDPAASSEHCYLLESLPDLVRIVRAHDASGARLLTLVRTAHGEMSWTQWRAIVATLPRCLGREPADGDGRSVAAAALPDTQPASVPARTTAPPRPVADAAPRDAVGAVRDGSPARPAARAPTRPVETTPPRARTGASDVEFPTLDLPAPAKVAARGQPASSSSSAAPSPAGAAELSGAAVELIDLVMRAEAALDERAAPLWEVLVAGRAAKQASPPPGIAARPAGEPRAEDAAVLSAAPAGGTARDRSTTSDAVGEADLPARPLAAFLRSAPRPAAGNLSTGATLGVRYVIERSLDAGHLARLFVARDEVVGRRVMVRVPDPRFSADEAFCKRFADELRKLLAIQHPHVARVLDIGEDSGRPFAVLQLIEGGTLEDRMQQGGVTAKRFLEWLTQVGDALDALHAHGCMHREVEPRNVLLDSADNAYLCDFGMTRAIGAEWSRMTQSGVLPGAPAYMPPEAAHDDDGTPAWDQYSLAVIAYRAISGRFPHEAPSPMALLLVKQVQPAKPLAEIADVPLAASRVLGRALAADPDARLGSCAELARELRAAYRVAGMLDRPIASPRGSPAGAATEATTLPPLRPPVGVGPTARAPLREATLVGVARARRAPARPTFDVDDVPDAAPVRRPAAGGRGPRAARRPLVVVLVALAVAALGWAAWQAARGRLPWEGLPGLSDAGPPTP